MHIEILCDSEEEIFSIFSNFVGEVGTLFSFPNTVLILQSIPVSVILVIQVINTIFFIIFCF